jgi:hypothetical protein
MRLILYVLLLLLMQVVTADYVVMATGMHVVPNVPVYKVRCWGCVAAAAAAVLFIAVLQAAHLRLITHDAHANALRMYPMHAARVSGVLHGSLLGCVPAARPGVYFSVGHLQQHSALPWCLHHTIHHKHEKYCCYHWYTC